MNELINDEAVYRTAQATPGLLKIRFFQEERKRKTNNKRVLITITRSNKVLQALQLPKIANVKPRSIFNKVD